MSRYKVGDTVKIIRTSHPVDAPVGATGTVEETQSGGVHVRTRHYHGLLFHFDDEVELVEAAEPIADVVNSPSHYTWIDGVECKDVVSHFNYNKGTAIAYIWRSGHKGTEVQDLKKAIKHLQFEVEMLESAS